MIQKTTFAALCAALLTVLTPASQAQSANAPTVAAAAAQSPDQLINRLSNELLDAVRADKSIQAGDTKKMLAIVDERVVPYVSFQRMTSSAVGRYWRQATPEQQASLENEFKTLLMRTYAGALSQVKDQTVAIKPSRNLPEDEEQIVRTEVRGGGGDPVQLDYRVEKSPTVGWKIYDVNVLGVWLVENYRNSFAQEISKGGIDGLIAKLSERNKSAASRK
jgi:phospholipid transport system substrate-binding protein